jgi:hypothetical protein
MIVDATPESGDECDLLGGIFFGFGQGGEDGAEGAACWCAASGARWDGLGAGVEDRILAGGHALIPALRLRVGVKEQQRA